MTKEICFIIRTPLTDRDYERFGVSILQSRGFKVSFLDLTMLLNPNYIKNYVPPDPSCFLGIVMMKTWRDVSEYLERNHFFLVVDLIGGTAENIFLYRAFKKHNITYASFRANSIPSAISCYKDKNVCFREKVRAVYRRLRNPNFIAEVTKILRKIKWLFYSGSIQQPAIVLAGGTVLGPKLPKPAKGSQVISAHTLDYDLYLKHALQSARAPKNDSIVFLDGYDPFYPSYLIWGNLSFDPEIYYGGLRRFFSYIEGKTGLPVKIAAHPTARYDLHPDFFQGRAVISGKTDELAFDAKIIVTNASTAVAFAVLYKKPLIFLTSKEIKISYYGALIRSFAQHFNKTPINVDEDISFDLENMLAVDENRYALYRSRYIKVPGSPEKGFWNIVADNLERLGYV